ncbi:MAG: arsenical pump membrane protein [Alcanivorax sp.]|jgi:arsenical pump membrane protein
MILGALARPKIGRYRLGFTTIGMFGVVAIVSTGEIPAAMARDTIVSLAPALATIASLMVIAGSCVSIGLLDRVTSLIVRFSRNDSRRLLSLLFWVGAAFGALFTNDAAVLLLTPLAMQLCLDRREQVPETANLPFLFAVLYVGNLVGFFVTSNPINIIAASFFDISFVDYVSWMALPALASMFISWWALLIVFRKDLREHPSFTTSQQFLDKHPDKNNGSKHQLAVSVMLGLVLLGFMLERVTGVPVWQVALTGALVIFAYVTVASKTILPALSRVDLPILVFMAGIFVVAAAVRNAGLVDQISLLAQSALDGNAFPSIMSLSALSAVIAAFINNHSTVSLMIWVVKAMELSQGQELVFVLSTLIGADLGPKMLPVGSLAALMWLRMLHANGFSVRLWTYIKIGVPVTVVSVVVSSAILTLQYLVFA